MIEKSRHLFTEKPRLNSSQTLKPENSYFITMAWNRNDYLAATLILAILIIAVVIVLAVFRMLPGSNNGMFNFGKSHSVFLTSLHF